MAKKNKKEETSTVTSNSSTEVSTVTGIDSNEITKKRNKLIAELKPLLLSKSVIKRGGPGIKSRYESEKGYVANVQEINELGRQIGEADVSLGSLRDD